MGGICICGVLLLVLSTLSLCCSYPYTNRSSCHREELSKHSRRRSNLTKALENGSVHVGSTCAAYHFLGSIRRGLCTIPEAKVATADIRASTDTCKKSAVASTHKNWVNLAETITQTPLVRMIMTLLWRSLFMGRTIQTHYLDWFCTSRECARDKNRN